MTAPARSTSRRPRRSSSRRPACRSPSTATGRSPRARARPTSSRRSASGWTTRRESAAADLRDLGFAFLFAPGFHPAMRHAGPTRREIGVRTAFNLLGPLTNPAGATRALLGVGDATAAPRMAEVAQRLGTERTLIVHGAGVDELPLDGSGVILDVTPDGIERIARRAEAPRARAARDLGAERRHGRRERRRHRLDPRRSRRRRGATSSSSTPVPRSSPRAASDRCPEGSPWPPRRSMPVRARISSTGCVPRRSRPTPPDCGRGRGRCRMTIATRPSARAGVVAEIAARRRADVLAELAGLDRAELRRRVRCRAGAAADRRTAGRAGSPPHRRDQARLAVGRRDRGERRGHRRPGAGLPARRRGRDLGPLRAALVRWLGRRPDGGAGGGLGAGPGQGVRRRGAPARRPSRRRRGSRPPPRRRSIEGPASPGSSSAPWTSAWSRSSRPTTSASSRPPWRPGRGSSGSTTATSGRSTSIPSGLRRSGRSCPRTGW